MEGKEIINITLKNESIILEEFGKKYFLSMTSEDQENTGYVDVVSMYLTRKQLLDILNKLTEVTK